MKVIIAGCRGFNDYGLLKERCNYYLKNYNNVEIVSGCANGADKLGEKYAYDKTLPVKRFPADWSLGKRAGPLRNDTMARYADALIAFWDGKSAGTANMIDQAYREGLKVKVVMYNSEVKSHGNPNNLHL
jgi:hypothetical protein